LFYLFFLNFIAGIFGPINITRLCNCCEWHLFYIYENFCSHYWNLCERTIFRWEWLEKERVETFGNIFLLVIYYNNIEFTNLCAPATPVDSRLPLYYFVFLFPTILLCFFMLIVHVFLLWFRHSETSYGKRWKLHNTGLHVRREFLVDINRTPCPVGLRKEQMDYRALARTDPLQLLCTLFLFFFHFLVSPLFFAILRFFCSRARSPVVFYLA